MVLDDCGASGRYGPSQQQCEAYHKDHAWYLGVEDGVQRIKVRASAKDKGDRWPAARLRLPPLNFLSPDLGRPLTTPPPPPPFSAPTPRRSRKMENTASTLKVPAAATTSSAAM
jgi:hypothetical protein